MKLTKKQIEIIKEFVDNNNFLKLQDDIKPHEPKIKVEIVIDVISKLYSKEYNFERFLLDTLIFNSYGYKELYSMKLREKKLERLNLFDFD